MLSRVMLSAIILSAAIGGCAHHSDRESTIPTRPETGDLDAAVAIALAKLDLQAGASSGYKLVGARQLVLESRYVWRVTFKPLHLLPADPSRGIIGLGGEIFVNVDLGTGEGTVGFGE